MRHLFLRWGLIRSLIVTTLVAVLISDLIAAGLMLITSREIRPVEILIASVVPMIVSSLIGYFVLRLIFQLEEARVRLRQISITDELTQAANRRYFIDCLEHELILAKNSGGGFSVILFDLDDFKQINDRYGHSAGDEVLRRLSEKCRQISRATDVFARYGGEEFVFLLPQSNRAAANNFAERIRALLEQMPVEYAGSTIHVTASFGVFTWQPEINDLEKVLVQVDGALYQAKQGGKNRVFAA